VIISSKGYILTNHHVVEAADQIEVGLADGRTAKARVIGSDPETDIAVIKIEAGDLGPLPIGDSAKVRVGQVVLAIGNPFGLSHTVTMGIISARGRNKMGITDYEDFFQTDAAINPGNSGGALINLDGELIGINTAIYSRTGGNEGVGFAIPSNQARKIMDTLIKHGSITRGYLGIGVQEISPDLATQLELAGTKGALVGEVQPDTPAAAAGFEPGDVIVKMDGKDVESGADLRNRIAEMAPGTSSTFEVIRDSEHHTLTATLIERPGKEEMENPAAPRSPKNAGDASFAGMTVANVSADLARRFNIPNPVPGVIIVDVNPNGRAAEAGLEPGDIIYRMNRENIATVNDFKAVSKKAGKEPVLLQVKRGPASMFIVIPK
jgi:serine protease Do